MIEAQTMGPGTRTRGLRAIDYDRNCWPGTFSHHPIAGTYRLVTPVGNIVTVSKREVIVHSDRSISLRNDLVVCDGYDDDGTPINEWAGSLHAGLWTQTWGM